MATSYGKRLACDLILAHFGEIVQKVCKCLVYRGPLALGDIARFTQLNPPQLKSSLLVLIQHSCVQAFKLEHEGVGTAPARVTTSYIALCDNILHRMRFPKFLVLVNEDLGGEAESLVEGLLQHGRLTLEQMIQREAARAVKVLNCLDPLKSHVEIKFGIKKMNQEAPQAEGDVALSVKENFANLLRAHYVERSPAPEPSLHGKGPVEPPKKVARGGVRGRGGSVMSVNEDCSEEHKAMAAAAPSATERFQMISLIGLADSDPDKEMDEAPVGGKRKLAALQMDAKTTAAVEEKEVLWRVNFEEFLRRLRHRACVALVKSRVDPVAGTVLAAMLAATRGKETSAKQHSSVPISMDSITQAVRALPEGQHMTLDKIRGSVQQLAADSVGYLSRAGERGGPAEGGNSFVINMRNIIELRQRNEVEGIVLQRFGRECCRIFRLLALKGHLEQKQIGERAMVPKDVKQLLYRLLKDQYIQVEEIAKTTEHVASKSIHLWKVNYKAVLHKVLDDLYHSAANISLRLAHELDKEQEVMGLLRQPNVTLTSSQQQQVRRIRQITNCLEGSLLKLDEAILLFHDF